MNNNKSVQGFLFDIKNIEVTVYFQNTAVAQLLYFSGQSVAVSWPLFDVF